jgi:hypothetical protein
VEVVISVAKAFDANIDDLLLKDLTKETARPFGAEGEDVASTDATLKRVVELQELRIAELEREILKNDPKLASELGIE